ncbi:MAG: hypothetical protein R8G66_23840 [Cytophagales bacterium]|nr:hypothetical protein [Cytophagales bacterium]
MNTSIALEDKRALKWPEIYSLGALNAAVVISWIAYHEYQPVLVEKFNFQGLVQFMIASKAIILVVIPPLAGWLADQILKKNGKYFTVFTVGISATAMIFMIVASLIGAGPLESVRAVLPVMIVLWLIAMNLFVSPANSMIEAFAPAQKLPIVVGFLFLVTELIYALEPVIVALVRFFGDTITFVVGGILISVTGYIFHRVSSNEVMQRKKELVEQPAVKTSAMGYLAIVMVGLQLGIGKAFLVEFFPHRMDEKFVEFAAYSDYVALGLLALAAILAFAVSKKVAKAKADQVITYATLGLIPGVLLIIMGSSIALYILGGIITAVAFSVLNVSGLPFAIKNLSIRHITYGVGVFIGASELFTGLFDYFLH